MYIVKLKSRVSDPAYRLSGFISFSVFFLQYFIWTKLNGQEIVTRERQIRLVCALNCHDKTLHNISSPQLHGCNKRSEKPIFTFNLLFTFSDLLVPTVTLIFTPAEQTKMPETASFSFFFK